MNTQVRPRPVGTVTGAKHSHRRGSTIFLFPKIITDGRAFGESDVQGRVDIIAVWPKDELEIVGHSYSQLTVRVLGGSAAGFIPEDPLGGDPRKILTLAPVRNTLLAPLPAPAKKIMVGEKVPSAPAGCAISTGRSLIVTIDRRLSYSETALMAWIVCHREHSVVVVCWIWAYVWSDVQYNR